MSAADPSASLIASPLVQQERPTFQPKIVSLYEQLFKEEDDYAPKSDGFWTEFFLLKAHPPGLKAILQPMSGDDLLHLQVSHSPTGPAISSADRPFFFSK
ncbi:hypothetical protein AA313_de0206145 [Arthrobotrys entomopaga]|nr:hypothetical protein AA313_de0206145 [Arthrobotrys entomopaga]